MKPNFALKLSNDGAELLHREAAGWSPVGAVSFENDDVAAGCARLLAEAGALEPSGVRCKVVLPPDEVRYAMIVAPGPTDEARRYQIEAEIERLTPYTIDELSYDWAVEDDHALVVICARETLAEAETFAEGYGFNPVSFVAIPEPGQFVGEPWFGETLVAKVHVPAGDKVQRDVEAIRLVTRPATRAAISTAAAPVTAPPAARPAMTPPPAPASAAPPLADTRPAAPVLPAGPVPSPALVARPSAPAVHTEPPAQRAASPAPVAQAPAALAPTAPKPPRAEASVAPVKSDPRPDPRALVGDMVRRLGTRLRREQAEVALQPGQPPAPQLAAPAPPPVNAPATEAVAFASRRSTAAAVSAVPASGPARPAAPGPGGRIAILPADAPRKAAAAVDKARSTALAALSRVSALRRTAPADPAPIVPASRPPMNESDRSREEAAMTIFGARGNTASQPSMARRGLTVAGGLLLILVAVAVWALYFTPDPSDQLADASGDPATLPQIEQPRQLTSADPAPVSAPAALPAPDSPPEQVATAAPETAPPATPEPAPQEVVASDPDAMLETLVQQALDEALPAETVATAEAAAAVASQPVALAPVEAAASLDATASAVQAETAAAPVQQSAALPAVADVALSLPASIMTPATSEVAFAPPPPPPPFGTTFNFDASGLVEATPEGAMTPSGVIVYARRPAVTPAVAPRRAAPAPATQAVPSGEPVAAAIEAAITEAVAAAPDAPTAPPAAETAPAAPATEVVLDDTPRADPALAGARPRPRSDRVRQAVEPAPPAAAPVPDDQTLLQPVEPQTDTDTAAVAPLAADPLETPPPGGVSLAALRPQARPTDIVPAAAAAAAAPVASDLDLTGATPEAVAQSPVPSARPDDVAERARQILAAARGPAPAASSEAVEDDDGETASSAAAPSIPSSASVARQATETNAIDLGEINLIGVFGTPGDRRALVRLSSGRMVRLQVGDRLDGGEVSAIGENELRYTRNGRNEVLRIGG